MIAANTSPKDSMPAETRPRLPVKSPVPSSAQRAAPPQEALGVSVALIDGQTMGTLRGFDSRRLHSSAIWLSEPKSGTPRC